MTENESEATSLVDPELERYEFLVSLVVRYDILCAVNAVSKML
jgi:hypothetical protein